MIVKEGSRETVSDSKSVFKIMNPIFEGRPDGERHKEYFYIMGLDSQNRVLVIDLISFGTVNQCTAYIREIMRTAIIKNCASIICVHNHPSGNIQPSKEDIAFSMKIKKACDLFELVLTDHVIIADNRFFSMKDERVI